MASNHCPVCGKKVGGLTGEALPYPRLIEEATSLGVNQDYICLNCLENAVNEYKKIHPLPEGKESSLQNIIYKGLKKVFISPSTVPAEAQELGLITGYCILGTGPLTTLVSSVTDTLGIKSNAYLDKVRLAEDEAIDMLKLNALKAGGDSIYCVHISLAEATSGHGMLMVSVYGTAVKTQSPDEDIQQAIETLKD